VAPETLLAETNDSTKIKLIGHMQYFSKVLMTYFLLFITIFIQRGSITASEISIQLKDSNTQHQEVLNINPSHVDNHI